MIDLNKKGIHFFNQFLGNSVPGKLEEFKVNALFLIAICPFSKQLSNTFLSVTSIITISNFRITEENFCQIIEGSRNWNTLIFDDCKINMMNPITLDETLNYKTSKIKFLWRLESILDKYRIWNYSKVFQEMKRTSLQKSISEIVIKSNILQIHPLFVIFV